MAALVPGLLLFSMPASAWMDMRGNCFKAGHPVEGESLASALDPAPGCLKYTELAEAADILKRYPNMRVEVAGHADSAECTGHACQSLSARRARAIADHLRQNGVDPRQIVRVVGYGISRPMVDTERNPSEINHLLNRRVEINMLPVEVRHRRPQTAQHPVFPAKNGPHRPADD
ncbi:MAG: OmpA family protein [Pseudomonadota bacterium]|nr:OmpA family protein [Pseudomonadota bacterium]